MSLIEDIRKGFNRIVAELNLKLCRDEFLNHKNNDLHITQQQVDKLDSLESTNFRGLFTSLSALQTGVINPVSGNYAYVDAGVGDSTKIYIWDASDNSWVEQAGSSTTETPASIKQKYESNSDTNAFTDAEKTKLNDLILETPASIKQKYESNSDTNAFTDAEKTKLAGLNNSEIFLLDTGTELIPVYVDPNRGNSTLSVNVNSATFIRNGNTSSTQDILHISFIDNSIGWLMLYDSVLVGVDIVFKTATTTGNPINLIIRDAENNSVLHSIPTGAVTNGANRVNIKLTNLNLFIPVSTSIYVRIDTGANVDDFKAQLYTRFIF